MAYYDVSAAIDKPNLWASFQQGRQQAQTLKQNALLLKAAQQQQDDQNALRQLAPGILAGDPSAFDQASAIDPQAAGQYQSAADSQLRRLKGAVDYIESARQSGNMQAVEAAYQQVRPWLAKLGNGQQPPATFAEAEPQFEAAKAKIAMLGSAPGSDLKSVRIGDDGYYYAVQGGQMVNTGVKAAPNNQIIDTGNGFYGVNKGNLSAAPVMVGGGQQQAPQAPQAPSGQVQAGDGSSIYIDPNLPPNERAAIAANPGQFVPIDQGGTAQPSAPTQLPPVVQDGPAPQPQQPGGALPPALDYQNGGQQLRSVPKPGNQPHAVVPLSPDEIAQLGLQPGTFAQRDTVTGELKFGPAAVQGPKPMSEYQRQQLQMKSGKAKAALSGTVADLDRMGSAVRKVMNSPGLDRITGLMGALPNIPGSDAANAEADLDALKSQIAFAVLAKMRAMSPTGGALGSVSDAEGKRLEANLAALDKAQSADQMRARLQDILDYIDSSKGNLRGAYDEQFGEQGGAQAPAQPQAQRPALPSGFTWGN